MKPSRQRLLLILAGLAVLGVIAALVLTAFHGNLVLYFSPTEIAAGKAPKGSTLRVGGVVKEGSVRREADGVSLGFVVTDTEKDLPVRYRGLLPDLFREGKGIVVRGKIGDDGIFTAIEVHAKHDENYAPPEMTQAVGDAQKRKAVEAAVKTLRE